MLYIDYVPIDGTATNLMFILPAAGLGRRILVLYVRYLYELRPKVDFSRSWNNSPVRLLKISNVIS